jgi:hypothetical protein
MHWEKVAMKRICLAILMMMKAGFCFAQAPQPSFSSPTTDIFAGYMATIPDYGSSYNTFQINGAEVALSKALSPRLSLIASGAFVFGTRYNIAQYSGTAGVKVNVLTGRFRPYVTGQAGFSVQNSDGFYASDHHPPLPAGKPSQERGFSYRFGGGADLQVASRIYVRLIQFDIQPQPWGRHTPWYNNFSTGIGYQF